MIVVALHTGLRQSEQFHLGWENVDFTTGMITVPRSKNGETRRLPMNDTVCEILRSRPSRLKSALVFPSQQARRQLIRATTCIEPLRPRCGEPESTGFDGTTCIPSRVDL